MITSGPSKPLGLTRYQTTVFFCDIRGFTHSFDQTAPEEVFKFVSSVFSRFALIVQDCHGSISSFSGDGFLAQFASPETSAGGGGVADDSGTGAANAVRCAIRMREEVTRINRERHAEKQFTFALGIGIHSGPVAGGHVQLGDQRLAIILGDTVNTASRIESLCKFFSVDVLISDTVEKLIHGKFPVLPMPLKELRGKVGKHQTYWVMPTGSADNPS